jgi:hypothetical protein
MRPGQSQPERSEPTHVLRWRSEGRCGRAPDRVTGTRYAAVMVRTLDLTPWAGRWVAVDAANHVRCDAPSLSQLLDVLASADLGEVEVMRAPALDEPVVYGRS